MKVATVLESSDPLSIILKHRGIISVLINVFIISGSSDYLNINHTFTNAPITPKAVSLRYSKGLLLFIVFKKG